ncbi:MAG: GAF domain-containing protein [Planctomycetota bacterium]|jgi:PAS domain S-box-containing protein
MTNSTDQFDTALDPQKSYPSVLSAGQGTCPTDGRAATSQEQEKSDLLQRQEAIVAMGRRAIAPPDLPILMQDGADLLAEMLGMEYGLVAERSPDAPSPQLRMALRSAEGTEPQTPICATSTVGTDSLAGYALQMALPVVVADLPGEKRFVDDFLRNHGIRSAIAVPLKLQNRSFGSLAACSSRIRNFNDEDLLFAETIAHLVTTALGRAQAERSLADERRLRAGVLQTVDALVLVLDSQRQIVSINPACERLTGFSLQEIKGRQIWSVLSVAEEAETCRRLLDQLQQKKAPVEYESWLLTKHSQKRRIAWTCDVIADDDGPCRPPNRLGRPWPGHSRPLNPVPPRARKRRQWTAARRKAGPEACRLQPISSAADTLAGRFPTSRGSPR